MTQDWYDIRDTRNYWFNYETGEYDYIDTPATSEAMLPYVPNIPAARGMFQCLIQLGNDPLNAAGYVLEAVSGVEHTIEVKR